MCVRVICNILCTMCDTILCTMYYIDCRTLSTLRTSTNLTTTSELEYRTDPFNQTYNINGCQKYTLAFGLAYYENK